MRNYPGFAIQHWQLSKLDDLNALAGNCYLVFWCDEVPLAHLWWQGENTAASEQLLHERIRNALLPAISHYLDRYKSESLTAWKQHLEEGRYRSLASLLTECFTETILASDEVFTQPISVIICTRNRPAAIEQCIKSMLACTDQNFELIVVDNAPDDSQTRSVLAGFPGVKYILENRKGLDIARNTGIRHASHDIIAYTDDDVIIPVNWITHLRQCFKDPLTMAVTGLVMPFELNTESQIIFERDWSFNKGYSPKVFNHRYFLDHLAQGVPAWDVGAGANMAFRKQAFQLAGLFDERLDVGASGCSGDSEMWYRIMAEGWNCNYFPHLYVYHQHRDSMTALDKQLFSYMRGHVSALMVQFENYGHKGNLMRLYKSLPVYYYHRAKDLLLKKKDRSNTALLTEIKGCFSGWKFYKANKHRKRHDIYTFPENIKEDATTNHQTLVSVIIPCYNHSRFLKQAIESVFNQTHQTAEVIVVDDGSQDETDLVCAAYGQRVKYVRVERVGVSAARNIGIQFSRGEYIVFLDADDYLYASALELNLYYFNYYRDVVYVSGGHVRVDEKGNYLPSANNTVRYGNNYWSLLQGNYIAMEGSVMYRRSLFFHFHFDSSLVSCEDYDLNLNIARYFPVFGHAETIAAYRIHSNNTSGNTKLMRKNALEVLKRQQHLLINEEERLAYAQGMENWQNFYPS